MSPPSERQCPWPFIMLPVRCTCHPLIHFRDSVRLKSYSTHVFMGLAGRTTALCSGPYTVSPDDDPLLLAFASPFVFSLRAFFRSFSRAFALFGFVNFAGMTPACS
jgi:hypothetical protein